MRTSSELKRMRDLEVAKDILHLIDKHLPSDAQLKLNYLNCAADRITAYRRTCETTRSDSTEQQLKKVREFFRNHPGAKQIDCARLTGLEPSVIVKCVAIIRKEWDKSVQALVNGEEPSL